MSPELDCIKKFRLRSLLVKTSWSPDNAEAQRYFLPSATRNFQP